MAIRSLQRVICSAQDKLWWTCFHCAFTCSQKEGGGSFRKAEWELGWKYQAWPISRHYRGFAWKWIWTARTWKWSQCLSRLGTWVREDEVFGVSFLESEQDFKKAESETGKETSPVLVCAYLERTWDFLSLTSYSSHAAEISLKPSATRIEVSLRHSRWGPVSIANVTSTGNDRCQLWAFSRTRVALSRCMCYLMPSYP